MSSENPALIVGLSLSPSEASCLLHAVERAIDHAAPFARGRLESVQNKLNEAIYGKFPMLAARSQTPPQK